MGYNQRSYYREVHSNPDHLEELETEGQTAVKVSRRKEIIKIRQETKLEIKKHQKNQENQELVFERINNINKPLARLTKKKTEDPNK